LAFKLILPSEKQTELEMLTANAALEQQSAKYYYTQITQDIRSSLDPKQIFKTAARNL
jgi:hypothetical protein